MYTAAYKKWVGNDGYELKAWSV